MELKEGFIRRVAWYWAGPAIQIVIGIAMLPLTTLKLDPADFGFFALVSAAVAVASALAGLGGGFVLTAHFQNRDLAARARLNSTILATQMVAALILGCALFVLLPPIVGDAMETGLGTNVLYTMASSGVFLATTWTLAQEVLVLEGRASTFTLLSLVGTIVTAVGTLIALFVLELDVSALFVGEFIGKAILFICGFVALREQLTSHMERAIAVEVLKLAPFSATASAAQHFSQMIYRSLLNAHANLAQLGLFVHAQSYERYALTSIKAVSRSVWPINLAEARKGDGIFTRTQTASRVIHLAITAMGLVMALFGREIIGLLTHGKFVEAAPYAALLFVVLMAKYLGRADLAILYAASRGRTISNLSLLADLGAVLIAFVLIPHLALYGAVVALFMREIIYRLGLMVLARSFRRMYLHDGWAAVGAVLLIAVVVLENAIRLSASARGMLIILFAVALAMLSWKEARPYLRSRITAFSASVRTPGRLR